MSEEENEPIEVTQMNFINAAADFEAAKKIVGEKAESMRKLAKKLGVDATFQDPVTGVVYRIAIPTGRFVEFPPIGYVRTRDKALGEKQGSLSLKDARDAGYEVE